MKWNAEQYLKFEQERTQPALDLIARIPLHDPQKVLDIGCGPGNSTQQLQKRFPYAEVVGIDSSEEMIKTASAHYPNIKFLLCDATKDLLALNKAYDVVFSNACIQWVPDHPNLLKNMMALLNPGGVLAVQTPINEQEPIHQIIKQTVSEEKWVSSFPNPRVFYNLSVGAYHDVLAELSDHFSIWQITYYHTMHSHQDIMEWYRGTGLRPYLSLLKGEQARAFEEEIYQKVVSSYPVQQNGTVLFPFPRLFFTAVKE